jgi:fatty-acyl-CoA synthase
VGGAARQLLPDVQPADIAQLLYTSGTTGRPKGVLLHHRGLVLTPPTATALFDLGDEARWMNPMPMFHVGGCGLPTIGSVAIGATQILLQRYRSDVVLALIGAERVSFFGGVPAMIYDLLHGYDPDRHDWSSLQLLLSGAAAVSPAMVTEVEQRLGVRFCLAYGQTEASGHISQTVPGDSAEDKAYTVGRPLPHVELRIVDPDTGRDVEAGTEGEIWCRSAAVTAGYVNQPDATAALLTAGGWLRTGDAGRQDARGYLTYTGRLVEIINRGGEKFAPREIQDALASHPSVAEAAVIGVPDDRLGQRVAAYLRPAADGCDVADLKRHLSGRLAAYKIPEHWIVLDQLPTTSSGKVSRQALLEHWNAQQHKR